METTRNTYFFKNTSFVESKSMAVKKKQSNDKLENKVFQSSHRIKHIHQSTLSQCESFLFRQSREKPEVFVGYESFCISGEEKTIKIQQ